MSYQFTDQPETTWNHNTDERYRAINPQDHSEVYIVDTVADEAWFQSDAYLAVENCR